MIETSHSDRRAKRKMALILLGFWASRDNRVAGIRPARSACNRIT
jgi:hypothetical protein